MKKRTAKEKREAAQLAALTQRLTDIYSGAVGIAWDEETHWPGAEDLSRIMPAVREVFEGENIGEFLFKPRYLDRYDQPSVLAKFLFENGVRA